MNALKRLGTGILSFLLLVSLAGFGIAFFINSTILKPDFVAGQVDKLDMAALASDYADDVFSEDRPQEVEFLKEAVYKVASDQEPWLTEQFNIAVYDSYDYFLGKTDRLEIYIPLDDLKANVKNSLWETLKDFLARAASAIPQSLFMPYIDEYYQDIVDVIPSEYLPPGMVGLSGESLRLYIHQHYNEFMNLLETTFRLPAVSNLVLGQIPPYFNQYYDDFVDEFEGTQTITEDDIPSDVMENFQTVRKSIGYFQAGYYALIVFMVLLVAGIILINRRLKDSSHALGIVFLVYGIGEFAGVLFARYFNFVKHIPDLPPSMETWLSGFIKDILLPLQWFSLGILILGAVLYIVSVLYKPRTPPSPEPVKPAQVV
jgi:hypothetical protein